MSRSHVRSQTMGRGDVYGLSILSPLNHPFEVRWTKIMILTTPCQLVDTANRECPRGQNLKLHKTRRIETVDHTALKGKRDFEGEAGWEHGRSGLVLHYLILLVVLMTVSSCSSVPDPYLRLHGLELMHWSKKLQRLDP